MSTQSKEEKKVEKVIEAKVEEVIDSKVEKEVKKRIDQRMATLAKASVSEFKMEFKKQTLIAITGAFAFLIALTWRTPIQKSIDSLIAQLGLKGPQVYYEYIAAILITLVGVIFLIIISKWAIEKK